MRQVGTNIHYVPSNEVRVPTEEATGRGLKRILPIVVSFIVPVAAPWLAAKVGLSSALSGAFGTVLGKTAAGIAGRAIGSALTGAALGAATGTGAGAGAVSGLLGSFTGAGRLGVGKSRAFASPGTQPFLPGGPGSLAPGAKAGLASNRSIPVSPLARGTPKPPPTADGPFRGAGSAVARPTPPSSVSGPLSSPAPGAPVSPSPAAPAPVGASASGAAPATAPSNSGFQQVAYNPNAQTAIQQAGSRVMKTLTDPDTILRAGMFLATGAISGSPEEQAAIREQAEALRELRERDSQAFNMRMQLAQQAASEASFYDPLAIANWAAAEARTSAAAAAQQAQRESVARGPRDTGRAAATRQAGLLQTALRGSEAFARGYGQGRDARLRGIGAAAGLIPTGGPLGYFEGAGVLAAARRETAEEERRRAAGIGGLFGNITGAPQWT